MTTRSPRRERRARHGAGTRRNEILTLACDVIAEKGFAAATMRDVADAVGILPGSLYHHFTSKDEIARELLESFYADVVRDLQEILDLDLSAGDTLAKMIELSCRYVVERRSQAAFALRDFNTLALEPTFHAAVQLSDEVERMWTDVLRRGMQTGQFRRDLSPNLVFRTVIASLYATIQWYEPTGEISPTEFTAQMRVLILDGVRYGEHESD